MRLLPALQREDFGDFQRRCRLRVALLSSGNSSFEDAEFNGNIEFGDARFENETSFYRILFKRPAYFENCSIKSLNLTKAEYSRLHLRWDDIESLHFDEAAYLALIKNYNTLGWYGDANKCYYDYRNAVRKNWMAASSTGFEARILKVLDLAHRLRGMASLWIWRKANHSPYPGQL